MTIELATSKDAIPGTAFAGKVFCIQNLMEGVFIDCGGYGVPLVGLTSELKESSLFQLVALPSGEVQLFSRKANSFVSGVNEGTPQHPTYPVLQGIVGDEMWSRFILTWDASDATFTLMSSYNKHYVSLMADTRHLRLLTPEPPIKGKNKDGAWWFHFRPYTVTGIPYLNTDEWKP